GPGNPGRVPLTDWVFQASEARGGSGNRGSGGISQFVGSATGGAIFTAARNTSGTPASLTLDNVTIRNNRAVGGDGNAAGGVVGTGIGGGLVNKGSNPFTTPGGSTIPLWDSTGANKQANGGIGGGRRGRGGSHNLG